MRRSWLAAALFGGSLGVGAGCLLDLDQRFSCGDGYVAESEECDPADPDARHIDACRALGFPADATCDPITCTIRDDEAQCNVCGDGVAAGNEQCDGNDLQDATCPQNDGPGQNKVECRANCTLDFDGCPEKCGDGIVTGNEECDPVGNCESDFDCPRGHVCYIAQSFNECVPSSGAFAPLIACGYFPLTAVDIEKDGYSSGTISGCSQQCLYGRNECGFCGDGVLDGPYSDFVAPTGSANFAAEICDGQAADPDKLAAYCRPLCLEAPFDPNASVRCDFECQDGCKGFELPDDISPGEVDPASLACCLGPGSRCEGEGVPDLPCCAAPDKPKDEVCVWSNTPPMAKICPDLPIDNG